MSALWIAWALSTFMAIVFAILWIRALVALTDAEIDRDELADRLIFAPPTSFRDVGITEQRMWRTTVAGKGDGDE